MTLRSAALKYAAQGWHVFPCVARDKHPLTARGFLEASTDPAVVAAWWDEAPEANIGMVPGRAGLVVVDVDGTEGMSEAVALGLCAEPTLIVQTARGEHRYYRHPGGSIPNRKLASHIDVRADAGYVLVPPSRHPSGARYRTAVRCPPIHLPPLVLQRLSATDDSARPVAALLPGVIPAGQRNAVLTSLAGSARRRGATRQALLALLEAENVARCVPPLSQRELAAIVASVGKYAPATAVEVDDVPESKSARNAAIASEAIAMLGDQERVSSWGWRDFDQRFGALVAGWLYVIGGRPGAGKTTLLLNILSRLWEDRIPTLYFGTEMAPADLTKKWAALRLGFDELATFEGSLGSVETAAMEAEIRRLLDQPLVTFSTAPRLDVAAMAQEMTWAFDRRTGEPPRVVILDHLHQLTQDREELQVLARELRYMATERRVALVVAAQLSREQGVGPFDLYTPPGLGRYKNSSAIEETVDVALALYRPLKAGLSGRDRRLIEQGAIPVTDWAEPNTMAILCNKHRYRGSATGRTVALVLRGSRLEARAFQPDPVEEVSRYGDAFEGTDGQPPF